MLPLLDFSVLEHIGTFSLGNLLKPRGPMMH